MPDAKTDESEHARAPSVWRRRARAVGRALLGDRPAMIALLLTPTLLAIALDFVMRPRSLLDFPPFEWLNYTGSSLASAGFWGGPMWLVSRLFTMRSGRARILATAGLVVFFGALFLPYAVFAYGGQALYYRIFHAYMGRETVRLGIALRGTFGAWLTAWGGTVVLMVWLGLVATAVVVFAVRKAAPSLRSSWPIVPLLGFAGATFCFWIDFVESRSLQAAPPDTCFIHGVVTAFRFHLTRRSMPAKGVSLREPAPLPFIEQPAHRPNVVVILTESVRADAVCSEPGARTGRPCYAPFLDREGVALDRLSLGKLTSQASGTFSACIMLWSGLPPDVDIQTAHRSPLAWELARAVGYRTAYITSQNLRYDDLAAYVQRAGIDVQASAVDFGDTKDPHLGAPDERATERMLRFVRETRDLHGASGAATAAPYFGIVHLSNTHWPYRVDHMLEPHAPHDENPLGDVHELHNHYRNSVLMQERTVASFVASLRAIPGWSDTVVIFLSDHGEQFREHGRLYHLNNVFDEEVRVPGWLVAGEDALTREQRASLALYRDRRTYSQDLHATLLDLFGVLDQRPSLPYGQWLSGRSLLRPPSVEEPEVLLSTTSGVWEDDDPQYGVMRGDKLLVGGDARPFMCFDAKSDPAQHAALSIRDCGTMIDTGKRHFPMVPPR